MAHKYDDEELKHEVEEVGDEMAEKGCGACNGCFGFCGFADRNRVITILGFAAVGLGIGIGLSFWEPDDPDDKKVAIQWIGLVGDLFLRSLKCFVLPLVFVNVIISVVDMMSVGKASTIGWTVIGLYLSTTIVAAFFGCMSTLAFMGLYQTETFEESSPPYVLLGCASEGTYLAETNEGNVVCSANFTAEDPNVNFIIEDVSKTFVKSSGGTVEVSLSDTIYQGIFQKIVPDNIIGAFDQNNFAAVIFFAILFGVALSRVVLHAKGKQSHLMGILNESDSVFQLITLWIIFLTPFAVCSLIAAAIGRQSDLGNMFKNIGYLVGASLLGWGFQVLFVYIGFYFLMTRRNPLSYLAKMVPAMTMAFACASSAATIPTSIASVMSTGLVNETVARFVIPFGATVNMDGGAVYFVCACVWLAVLNGEEVTAVSFIMLVIIATVGSIGTAPVPSASLVLIITAYNTVFGTTGTPNGFGYIFAIDWFMDRCRTVTNVTGDCVVAGIVAYRCPIDEPLQESVSPKTKVADEIGSGSSDTEEKE
ncbi:sodium:dicarboxylate symporter [Nitzschia inconspicua]|uniref:Sodium:dicarboxylate symporter n=1 Tax=Nitzschia inconspicua TaxID=303405 RepID=A0A9K3LC43_9STRA|nr:sodium:dicarboxylate symporter [Nitzschia inconspicua]